MPYNDDQARDDHGRWTTGSGPSDARAERVRLNAQVDERRTMSRALRPFGAARQVPLMEKIMTGLRNKYGAKAPTEDQVRLMMQTGAHSMGVHLATTGKTLGT